MTPWCSRDEVRREQRTRKAGLCGPWALTATTSVGGRWFETGDEGLSGSGNGAVSPLQTRSSLLFSFRTPALEMSHGRLAYSVRHAPQVEEHGRPVRDIRVIDLRMGRDYHDDVRSDEHLVE